MTDEELQSKVDMYTQQCLDKALPEILKSQRHAVHLMIAGHNTSAKAHDGAATKINKLIWGFGGIVALTGLIATLKAIFSK